MFPHNGKMEARSVAALRILPGISTQGHFRSGHTVMSRDFTRQNIVIHAPWLHLLGIDMELSGMDQGIRTY